MAEEYLTAEELRETDEHHKRTLYCSFCGKSQHEVRKLIAGPSTFICDECVEVSKDILRKEQPPTIEGTCALCGGDHTGQQVFSPETLNMYAQALAGYESMTELRVTSCPEAPLLSERARRRLLSSQE